MFKQWTFYYKKEYECTIRDSHPLWFALPSGSSIHTLYCQSRFLSPILTGSRLMFFPVATKMFQFTTCKLFYSLRDCARTESCGFPLWEHAILWPRLICIFRISVRPYCFGAMASATYHLIWFLLGKSWLAKDGLEPSTSGLWILCSNQLSYLAHASSFWMHERTHHEACA